MEKDIDKDMVKIFEILESSHRGKTINYKGVVGKALLEQRTYIKKHCSEYDPFGLCNIMECLSCENCYYKITLENGESISNTEVNLSKIAKRSAWDSVIDDDHEILFYDYIPKITKLLAYLSDEESQFRVIRKSDNEMMVNKVSNEKKLIKFRKSFEK